MTETRRAFDNMNSDQMQTALDIFGTTDFPDLGEGSYEEEEDYFTELGPEELREERFKALKKAFEPSELKDKFATEEDEEIRVTDIPERIQLRMPHRYASPSFFFPPRN